MSIRPLAMLTIALSATSIVCAQSSLYLPNGSATVEGGSSNTFPWGRNAGAIRNQHVYDSSHFTAQGVTFPILITGARWRADDATTTTTWTGTTYNSVEVSFGSSALDWASLSTTWANNRGPDYTQMLAGSVAFAGGAGNGTLIPGPTVVDLTFGTPFLYDPNAGSDFLCEVTYPANSNTGGTTTSCDVVTTGSMSSRVFNSTDPTAATGTLGLNHAIVMEILYVPAAGLHPNFTATPTSGATPLNVTFTDQTFTSDPSGVQTWAWDLDGDGIVDSNAQHPSFTYTLCGPFDVTLTVTDTLHPSSTITKNDFVFADPQLVVTANFAASPTGGIAPLNVNFTDTSTGSPTAWQWDLDGDSITDSAAQNPSFTYTSGGQYTVTLTASNGCFGDSETKVGYINVAGSGTNLPADKLAYQFNEVRGGTVANVATGATFPARGTLTNSNWQGAPGVGRDRFDANEAGFGTLRRLAGTYVQTGAPIVHSGNFTVMWWFRRDPSTATSTTTSYAFSDGTFRAFHGGVAGTGIWFRGTSAGDMTLNQNIVANPAWQHIALVVDDTAGRWDWYLNGAPASTGAFTPSTFTYTGTTNLQVGATAAGSLYTVQNDMDDFRMYNAALTFGDVIASMAGEVSTNGPFDSGCAGPGGLPVLSASQRPTIPNPTYSLDLTNAEPSRPAAMVFGVTAHVGGLFPIDLSGLLGAGCSLSVFPDISFPFSTGAGAVNVPVPLPVDPSLNGYHGYVHTLILGTSGATSNALDVNMQID